MQVINNKPKQQRKKSILKSQSLEKESKKLLIIKHKSNKKHHTNEQQSPKPYKLMTQLKNIFQKQLPSSLLSTTQNTSQQLSQLEGKYLLKLLQILQLLTTKSKQNNNINKCIITPQMLFTIINVQNLLNQLLRLFNNLIQNKQIVIAIFHQIYHKLMNHIISIILGVVKANIQKQQHTYVDNNMILKVQKLMNFLNKQLFDSIEFLLQFQCGIYQQQLMLFQQKLGNNRNVIINETYSQSNRNDVIDKDIQQMMKRLIPVFETTYKYYKWIYQSLSTHLLMMRQKQQSQQKIHHHQNYNQQLCYMQSDSSHR